MAKSSKNENANQNNCNCEASASRQMYYIAMATTIVSFLTALLEMVTKLLGS